MRIAIWIAPISVLLASLTSSGALHAQAGAQSPGIAVRDGGTREVLESILIPPMDKAPLQLTLVTEWVRPLGTDGTYTLANQRHIMRDGAGRIYQER